MSITLVVPTYQEAGNIERFLKEVRATVPELDVVVCDDNSPDGTGDLAEKVNIDIGGIHVLHRPSKEGLGAAYREGFRYALDHGADIVVQMDVDFSHPPDILPDVIGAVRNGADVSVGSRYVEGGSTPDWTLHRRFLSRYGNLYANAMLKLTMSDATSGLRAYTAEALEGIHFDSTRANGYGFQIETAYRLSAWGARISEVPLVFNDRVEGESKMSVKIMAENMALVTWWGICMRFPRLTGRFRRTAVAEYLQRRTTPST